MLCRCSVYTVCLAKTSLCASATATPAVAADTTPPVITVRAPASNSINATGYVDTTVYVGMSYMFCITVSPFLYVASPLSWLGLLRQQP